MAAARKIPPITRRTLLIGGGAGAGLLLAWTLWPRSYALNLDAGPGETVLNAFLKIGSDGRVVVAVPQAELGQGVWTSLPQIVADELGAAWETVSVEPSPIHPLYANHLLAEAAADAGVPAWLQAPGRWAAREYATRNALMATAGSTSIRAFERPMREAGAAARALLMKAAARRWGVEWDSLDTAQGFVVQGAQKIRFAELAEEAAGEELPDYPLLRGGVENRLTGRPVPRLDIPSKIDGSARFAADVRLPEMVFASVRSGPTPRSRLLRLDRSGAAGIAGVLGIFDSSRWVAVVASNWWAADRALERLEMEWEIGPNAPSDSSIEGALAAALEGEEGTSVFSRGDVASVFGEAPPPQATYSASAMANAPLETLTATARLSGDLLEVWAPAQAPGMARDAAARAAGLSPAQVTLYPMPIGGGYGRKLEVRAIEQAVVLALKLGRPVQLVWSRKEESMQDTMRPPARARMEARLGEGGIVLGWKARIAAPEVAPRLEERLGPDARLLRGPASATSGAVPPYAIPAVEIEHVAADPHIEAGLWRSGAHGYTCFFTECWMDELARQANIEPLSFRMQMLTDNPRLARCLSTAATLGGWDGGQPGSAMGIAAHSAFGSHIGTLVEIELDETQRVRVLRAVSAVDCGRVINPDILRQQIEGGLLFGIAAASGNRVGFERGRPTPRGFGHLAFPTLAGSPEVTVEIVESDEEPGGATELGVPTAAPAMANALFALTGRRLRSLPLTIGGAE